jgi:quinol monooxygenase YgiN
MESPEIIRVGGKVMISVIAKLPVKSDKVNEAVEAIKVLMTDVAKEEGTLLYTLCRTKETPNVLIFVEGYKDNDALKLHSSSPHFKAFSGKLRDFLEGKPEISVLEEIHSIR